MNNNELKTCGKCNISKSLDSFHKNKYGKNEEELIKLCHYNNLRPLCSYINRYVKK